MHLVRSHRLMYVQIPQVVPNLIFPYSGRSFSPLVPILQSINSGGARREVASRRLREKSCGVPQPSPHLLILGHHSCSSGGGTLSLTFFFWLTDLWNPTLLFLASPAKFSSNHTLAVLTPSLHDWAASLYSSQDTRPCFYCLCNSLLPFSLTSRS